METTGLNPRWDEIIELAVVLFAWDRKSFQVKGILDSYCGLREPSCPVSPGAYRVHGITSSLLRGQSLDGGRVEEILEKAEFIVAHNARFDRAFVQKEFPRARHKTWLCSLQGINWGDRGFSSRGLQSLLQGHGISIERAHRAGDDVLGGLNLLNKKQEGKETYLAELLKNHLDRG